MILDSPIISGSLTQQAGQIAEIPRYTDVSSSFLAASASFDSRIDSIESTTASLSPRINALESFTASADNTYVNVSGDSMSGNLTITGSLIVTDRITAQEFHTEYVSSSVVYESGSTKFGDSLDDAHSITGSLNITGSITLNGSAIGTGKLDETTFNSYTSSNDSKVDLLISATGSYETKGSGIYSSSAQLPSGLVSGSDQLTASLDLHYIVSGTITQTTWDNIENKPNGIVSGSSQLITEFDNRYLNTNGDSVVSGSSQIILQSTTGQLSSSKIDNLNEIHNESWTASVANDQFSIIHDGSNILTLTSGSTDINNGTLNITADSFANDYALGYTDFGLALNVEGDVVVTGSIAITGDITADNLVGLISGSDQLTSSLDLHYVISGSITQTTWDNIESKPNGIISGSSQLSGTTIQSLSGSFSGSYQGDGSLLRGLAAGAKFHTQTTPSSTWTFIHNLSTQYPNVTVYDSNNNIVLPQTITATNVDTLVLEFGSPVAGYATAGVGGIIEVNGRTVKQYFASSLEWRFEHNFGDRFANIQTYDSNYEKIIPQTITLTDATSSLITFPEVTEGWAIGTIGGDLPAISSSYGGYVLQVSDSAPYTASWTPAADVTVTNALTASYVEYSDVVNKPTLVSGSSQIIEILDSLNSFTASNSTTNTFTSSATARLDSLEVNSASVNDTNTSQNSRLDSLEQKTGSLATTGSNTFFGTQTFSGSVYIKENLIVQGSSSLQNITASAVDIGTNKIILNVDNPSVRYAGISVYDSGSTAGTGSLFWDSVNNYWLYEHPADSGAPYNSAILIAGPKNTGNLGEEIGLTTNYLMKAVGSDHISSSAIYDDGTTISLKLNTEVSGTLKVTGNAIMNNAFTIQGGSGLTKHYFTSAGSGDALNQLYDNTGTIKIQLYTNGNSYFNGGNIGIGTTNPQAKLDITGTTSIDLLYLDAGVNTDFAYKIASGADDALVLRRQHSTQGDLGIMSWTYSGKVGIGTTSPYGKFEIASSAQNYSTSPSITFTDTTGDASSNRWIVGNIATTYGTFNIASAPTPTSTTWTPRLSISSDGNVGVNASNPSAQLSGTKGISIVDSTNAALGLSNGTNHWLNYLSGTTYRIWNNSVSEVMTLTLAGSVGIGKTNPSSTLEVGGSITMTAAGGAIIWKNTSSSDKRWDFSNSGNNFTLNETGVNNRVTFAAGGNVGIGTTNPSYKLAVRQAASDWAVNFENTDGTETVGVYLAHGGGYGIAIDSSENDSKYIFKAMAGSGGGGGRGSVPVIFAQHNGNVGMGTESPSARLDINGGSIRMGAYLNNASSYIGKQYSGNGNFYSSVQFLSTTDQDMIVFNTHYSGVIAGEAMRITGMGNVGIGTGTPSTKLHVNGTITESSALRYKENVETLTFGLDKVIQMRGVSYIKKDTQTKEIGVIAEEMNQILPDIVSRNEDGEVESVSYGRITAVLIEAIKEQQKQIEELKSLIK